MKKQWFPSQRKRSPKNRRLMTVGILVLTLLVVLGVAGQTQRGNFNSLTVVYDIVPGGRYVIELINPPTAQGRATGTVRLEGTNAQVTSRWSDPYGRNSGTTLTLPTYGWAPYSTPYMQRQGSVWTSSAAQGNAGYAQQYQQGNSRSMVQSSSGYSQHPQYSQGNARGVVQNGSSYAQYGQINSQRAQLGSYYAGYGQNYVAPTQGTTGISLWPQNGPRLVELPIGYQGPVPYGMQVAGSYRVQSASPYYGTTAAGSPSYYLNQTPVRSQPYPEASFSGPRNLGYLDSRGHVVDTGTLYPVQYVIPKQLPPYPSTMSMIQSRYFP